MGKKLFTLTLLLACLVLTVMPTTVKAQAANITISAYDQANNAYVTVPIYRNNTLLGTSPLGDLIGITNTNVYGANATDSYGNAFKGYLVNGVLNLGNYTFYPNTVTEGMVITAIYSNSTIIGNYTLKGLNSETTGLLAPSGVIVTAYYLNGNPESFILNGTSTYTTPAVPLYFQYEVGTGTYREYWPTTTETTGTIYLTNGTFTSYVINFMDQTGILKNNPYVSAQTYVNGSIVTVEKRKVDSANSLIMNLEAGKKYTFTFSGSGTTYSYGEVLMTATTSVQLVIRGVDFPKESLLLYQYVHAYAVRDFLNPIGAITISYEDIKNQTTNVQIAIKYDNGTSVYNGTFINQTFSYIWASAVNSTNYQVTITITHTVYGTFYFKQYFTGENITPTNPLSLGAFGTITGIETAWFIPALLIIFVAACFSELTSEVACVLTVIMAWFLWAIGWISLTPSIIVTALAFSIMAGVVTVRRRFF